LKNKQTKKIDKSVETEFLPQIPQIKGASIEVIRHFEQFDAAKTETCINGVFGAENKNNFKELGKERQLKILLAYLYERSEEGIYKRESSKVIADHFNVSKDTIQRRFNELLDKKYIIELKQMNRFYKINKEWC
jgi:Fic family protein